MVGDGDLVWYWERTPAELFDRGQFVFIRTKPAEGLAQEVRSFESEKHPLLDTPFSYQIALSGRSLAVEVRDLLVACPELPISSDRRSGVLVFSGDQIIGSLIIHGHLVGEGYKMVVSPDFRQRGLAHRLLVEWCYHTKRRRLLPRQGITLASAKALLSAHKAVVARARAHGRAVPQRVIDAIEIGSDAAHILGEAARIEATATHEIRSV